MNNNVIIHFVEENKFMLNKLFVPIDKSDGLHHSENNDHYDYLLELI